MKTKLATDAELSDMYCALTRRHLLSVAHSRDHAEHLVKAAIRESRFKQVEYSTRNGMLTFFIHKDDVQHVAGCIAGLSEYRGYGSRAVHDDDVAWVANYVQLLGEQRDVTGIEFTLWINN